MCICMHSVTRKQHRDPVNTTKDHAVPVRCGRELRKGQLSETCSGMYPESQASGPSDETSVIQQTVH